MWFVLVAMAADPVPEGAPELEQEEPAAPAEPIEADPKALEVIRRSMPKYPSSNLGENMTSVIGCRRL